MRLLVPLLVLLLPALAIPASVSVLPDPPESFHYTVYVCTTDQEKAFGPQEWRWESGATVRRIPTTCADI